MQRDYPNKAMKPEMASNKAIDTAPETASANVEGEKPLFSFFYEAKDGKPSGYIDAHSQEAADEIYKRNN